MTPEEILGKALKEEAERRPEFYSLLHDSFRRLDGAFKAYGRQERAIEKGKR